MESEEREQDLQEAHDDAVAEADRMEDQAAELGESIDEAREARDAAHEEMQIAGTGPDPDDDDRMDEDPPAPAQEPPGDED
jgi:hypothetical protein